MTTGTVAKLASLPNDVNLRGDIALEESISEREPLVRGDHDFHYITETVCRVNEAPILTEEDSAFVKANAPATEGEKAWRNLQKVMQPF